MAGITETQDAAQMGQVPSDPWAAAFAALDKKDEEAAETAPVGDGTGDDVPDPDNADDGEGAAAPEGGDDTGAEIQPGGPGDDGGASGTEDEDSDWLGVDLSEDEIAQQRKAFEDEINERAIRDVAESFIKQGARHVNGRLGAIINDPDICKRDRDGMPRFYNPETGREFTGDNPRRQAQEWVESYNKELRDRFNDVCDEYAKRLTEQEGGRIAIIEFAPKYKALDSVRRSMFEAIIEDYEVTDSKGNIIAYSCDLDKALAAVNRQVEVIRRRYANQPPAQQSQQPAPSGPVLDTPAVGNTNPGEGGKPQFKSLAEAMEWEQDQLLAKMRRSK